MARRYWQEGGVADIVELHLSPAIETMDHFLAHHEAGKFDFIFIDADKDNYDGYYERALSLLRAGGLMAIDNVFWGGRVADPRERGKDTLAVRALNEKMRDDERVDLSMIPIGDRTLSPLFRILTRAGNGNLTLPVTDGFQLSRGPAGA